MARLPITTRATPSVRSVVELVLRPDAAADLQRDPRDAGQTRDHLPVRRRAVARAVEVDDVQSSGALHQVCARQVDRVALGSASRRRSALAAGGRNVRRADRWRGSAPCRQSQKIRKQPRAGARRSAPGGTACRRNLPCWITAANSTPYSQVASARRTGRRGKAVDEIDVLAIGDALQSARSCGRVGGDSSPCAERDVRGAGTQSLDPARNQAKTARIVLGARLVQQLHAEAYAEHRLRQRRQDRPRGPAPAGVASHLPAAPTPGRITARCVSHLERVDGEACALRPGARTRSAAKRCSRRRCRRWPRLPCRT